VAQEHLGTLQGAAEVGLSRRIFCTEWLAILLPTRLGRESLVRHGPSSIFSLKQGKISDSTQTLIFTVRRKKRFALHGNVAESMPVAGPILLYGIRWA
jgi:hypothetical protein